MPIEINLLQMTASIIAKGILTKGYEGIKGQLKDTSLKVISTVEDLDLALNGHLKYIYSLSQSVEDLKVNDTQSTDSLYIDLNYYLSPREENYAQPGTESKLIDTVFSRTPHHIAILGESGMGKTTSMKMIIHKLLTDNDYLESAYNIPIFIRLRDLKFNSSDGSNNGHHLTTYIRRELGINIGLKDSEDDRSISINIIKKVVYEYIDTLECLLILDGFDEIPWINQRDVYKEIDEIATYLSSSRLIVTSRTANFKYSPSKIRKFEICPLKDDQIQQFAEKRFGKEKALVFCNKILSSPFQDTARRPLILSFLASVYIENNDIPDKPRALYHEIFDILIRKWDRGRTIMREARIKDFDSLNMINFLYHLCFELLSKGKSTFRADELVQVYKRILVAFPYLPVKPEDVIDEIREHSGLIIMVDRENYEFPHKSLQEFLAANYIARYNPLDEIETTLAEMPYEAAIATTLASNHSNFFINMVQIIDRMDNKNLKYLTIYLEKLIEQQPLFPKTEKLALCIAKIWETYYSEHKITEAHLFQKLLNLNGVKESFIMLNEYYSLDPATYINFSALRDPDSIVNLNRRLEKTSRAWNNTLKVPIWLIKDWPLLNVKFLRTTIPVRNPSAS